jgi:hypothetical protein
MADLACEGVSSPPRRVPGGVFGAHHEGRLERSGPSARRHSPLHRRAIPVMPMMPCHHTFPDLLGGSGDRLEMAVTRKQGLSHREVCSSSGFSRAGGLLRWRTRRRGDRWRSRGPSRQAGYRRSDGWRAGARRWPKTRTRPAGQPGRAKSDLRVYYLPVINPISPKITHGKLITPRKTVPNQRTDPTYQSFSMIGRPLIL